jgi:hypothetical protein
MDSRVYGALSIITLPDLQRLDWFVVYQSLYQRRKVEVIDEQDGHRTEFLMLYRFEENIPRQARAIYC